MRRRYSPQAVQRALKLLEGSVLAVEVEHLQREVAELRQELTARRDDEHAVDYIEKPPDR